MAAPLFLLAVPLFLQVCGDTSGLCARRQRNGTAQSPPRPRAGGSLLQRYQTPLSGSSAASAPRALCGRDGP